MRRLGNLLWHPPVSIMPAVFAFALPARLATSWVLTSMPASIPVSARNTPDLPSHPGPRALTVPLCPWRRSSGGSTPLQPCRRMMRTMARQDVWKSCWMLFLTRRGSTMRGESSLIKLPPLPAPRRLTPLPSGRPGEQRRGRGTACTCAHSSSLTGGWLSPLWCSLLGPPRDYQDSSQL